MSDAQSTRLYIISNGWLVKPAPDGLPSLSLLIQHPQLGWILVDTGSHKDAMDGYWPETSRTSSPLFRTADDLLEARLGQVGLKPADVDWLILTHLHLDHAGGLERFCHTRAGQRVIVHEQELKQALYEVFVTDAPGQNAYLRSDFAGLPGIRFEPIYDDLELADDLHLLYLPGHSSGVLGVLLHLKHSGTIIYMSDAGFSSASYEQPVRPPGAVYDSIAYGHSIEKVRWLERRFNAKVIFGHDAAQFTQLKHSPEYYD